MPVLDAKALEIDPEGVAFLKSVLRRNKMPDDSPTTTPSGEAPRVIRVRFHMAGRAKPLLTEFA